MGMHGSHTGPSRIEGCSWPLGRIICGVLAGGGQFPLATRPAASKTGKEPAILSGISDAAAEDFVKSDLPSSGMAQRYCPHGWFDGLKTIENMMPFGTLVVQRRPIMDHGNVWECIIAW